MPRARRRSVVTERYGRGLDRNATCAASFASPDHASTGRADSAKPTIPFIGHAPLVSIDMRRLSEGRLAQPPASVKSPWLNQFMALTFTRLEVLYT